jgi:hypothetical protein
MSFLRYSEPDLRDLLSRAIRTRWPTEKLVVLTSCKHLSSHQVQSLPSVLQEVEAPAPEGDPEIGGSEAGFLAVTQSRLIFQEDMSSGLVLRAISAVVGALAVAVLFFGDGLGTFLPMAAVAVALWGVAKVLEMFLVGRDDIAFDHVGRLDSSSQWLEGTGRNGTLYRLGVPDRSDFLLVASLVMGRGAEAA